MEFIIYNKYTGRVEGDGGHLSTTRITEKELKERLDLPEHLELYICKDGEEADLLKQLNDLNL